MSKNEATPKIIDDEVLESLRQGFRGIGGELARWDLVRACRDSDFVITTSGSREYLLAKNLIDRFDEKGRAIIPDAVRSTVTATAVGEGLSIQIRLPAAR